MFKLIVRSLQLLEQNSRNFSRNLLARSYFTRNLVSLTKLFFPVLKHRHFHLTHCEMHLSPMFTPQYPNFEIPINFIHFLPTKLVCLSVCLRFQFQFCCSGVIRNKGQNFAQKFAQKRRVRPTDSVNVNYGTGGTSHVKMPVGLSRGSSRDRARRTRFTPACTIRLAVCAGIRRVSLNYLRTYV